MATTLDDLRTAAEFDLQKVLASLDRRHRAMLRAAIKKYGRVQNIPDSVWADIQRDTEDATTAAILLLLIAADEWTTDQIAAQGVEVKRPTYEEQLHRYAATAARRSQAMAAGTLTTVRNRLARNIEDSMLTSARGKTGELTTDGIDEALDDVFTDSRREGIAIDQTTGGFSIGQRAARDRAVIGGPTKDDGVAMTVALIWRTELDNLVCPRCSPLEGQLEDVWGSVFPEGPGPTAHPNCRCYLEVKTVPVASVA